MFKLNIRLERVNVNYQPDWNKFKLINLENCYLYKEKMSCLYLYGLLEREIPIQWDRNQGCIFFNGLWPPLPLHPIPFPYFVQTGRVLPLLFQYFFFSFKLFFQKTGLVQTLRKKYIYPWYEVHVQWKINRAFLGIYVVYHIDSFY